MDSKTKKTDIYRKIRLLKDSGDVRKIEKSTASRSNPLSKINKNCDRGDSIAKFAVERVRYNEKRLVDILPKNISRQPSRQKQHEGKTKDLNEMKKIRDNYTIRSKYYVKRSEWYDKNLPDKVESEIRNDRVVSKQGELMAASPDHVSSVKSPCSSEQVDLKRKKSSKTATFSQAVIRRAIIKTVTSKDDKSKVYKAVNFVERKVQPTQLQINIPTMVKRTKETKLIAAKVSVKEKRKRETGSYAKPSISPDVAVRIKSPPTEMAKWANVDHTKVYYEAWVNTTLAAISKKVKEKNFDRDNLMKTFEKALAERPKCSSDFDCKYMMDEKYTGKIRVNKR